MRIQLIGTGCGTETMTSAALKAISEAELIIGAERILASLPAHHAQIKALYKPEEIFETLKSSDAEKAAVVFSGDSGFFSGTRRLLPYLDDAEMQTEILPGISSLQLFSARIRRPWQDWKLCSAHGVSCDPAAEMMEGKPVFFLTGGKDTVESICRELNAAGLGHLEAISGEYLGFPQERIHRGKVSEFAANEYAPLSVLWVNSASVYPDQAAGIPDDCFIRGSVPMTKRNVRACILSHLRLHKKDVCWDIGAGTGSVSIEMALHSRAVWAIEHNPEAISLIQENRKKFCAWNLHVKKASAPEGLQELPEPDAVFVGGSGGRLQEILEAVHKANPRARILVSAIALETVSAAMENLIKLGYQAEVTQLSVSSSKKVGSLHMMLAENPVFLISGEIL